MFDILSLVPGKKKKTGSGWVSFNGVCCHHRGHKADKRSRGGLKFDGNNWTYHCFNCNFKTGFVLGKTFAPKTRQLLKWCGIDDQDIDGWNLYSLKHRDLLDYSHTKHTRKKIKFLDMALPYFAEVLSENNPQHKRYIDYIESRKIKFDEYPFMVTPNERGRNANRIIIPYTYKDKIVGHTSRYLDDKIPKYIKEQQPGYIFGCDLQKDHWEVCLVFEGIFDALSLNGCALTHDTISEDQADLLRSMQKRIIVVPDQDQTGLSICDRALELGFQVSLPNWGPGIKDANDSVRKYGRVATLLSILQAATNSKIKVKMARTKIDQRI